MDKRHFKMAGSLLLAMSFTACGGGGGTATIPGSVSTSPFGLPAKAPVSSHSLSTPTIGQPTYIAIDAGSSAAVGTFGADTDYAMSGSQGTRSVTAAIDTSHVTTPPSQAVLQTQRYATRLTYTIPNVTAGSAYLVRLHFVESFFTAPKSRVFNIAINGVTVATNYDIFAVAGGANIDNVQQFATTGAANGTITIVMSATVNNASIAALEVEAAASASPTPSPTSTPGLVSVLAINAGGTASGAWLTDVDYQNGAWSAVNSTTNVINTSKVASPAPPTVYQSQRFGPNFGYLIPSLTPGGAYTVRLHLVESFWTAVGQRVFSVTVNGAPFLTNFDIYKAAGGSNTAISEDLATHADTSGRITIATSSSVDNAAFAGVEILTGGGSGSATPTPTPSATPTPITTAGALPYVFSGTGVDCMPANNVPYGHCPFVSAISTLLANGEASVSIPSSNLSNWWNQQCLTCGGGGPPTGDGPIFVYSRASGNASGINAGAINTNANAVTAQITNIYGSTPWSNLATYLPSWAVNQAGCKNMAQPTCNGIYDQHMAIVDLYHGYEIDGWYCANVAGGGSFNAYNLNYSGGQPYMPCLYGGEYPLGGSGTWATSINGGSGQGGGAQLSAYIVTPQEILNAEAGTPISHALSYAATCLGAPGQLGVWPSRTGSPTDTGCTGGTPYANYGQFLHLVSSYNIAASGYSAPCKAILQALQTYGAMLSDTGGGGWYINAVADSVYADDPTHPTDPWNTVAQQLSTAGDGTGSSGANLHWAYCLNRLSSSDVEIVTRKQL